MQNYRIAMANIDVRQYAEGGHLDQLLGADQVSTICSDVAEGSFYKPWMTARCSMDTTKALSPLSE